MYASPIVSTYQHACAKLTGDDSIIVYACFTDVCSGETSKRKQAQAQEKGECFFYLCLPACAYFMCVHTRIFPRFVIVLVQISHV